jgi:Holliday junction DNA helicase RuvB
MPRPLPKFGDFIGQRQTVAVVQSQLKGAQSRNESYPHSLFHGPSGVGKTLLGRVIAGELGTKVIMAMGRDKKADLGGKLRRLERHDILFVDECHRLGPAEQEMLTEVIDDHIIPGSDDERATIPPWTLVLATDQPGHLLDALYKRIVLPVRLSYYPVDELRQIVAAVAAKPEVNILLTNQAVTLLAEVSGGLPRQAEQHLRKIRYHFPDAEKKEIGVPEIRHYLDVHGFDAEGLGPGQCDYLEALHRQGTSSLESISLVFGLDERFVRREIESPLVRRGLVRIARGAGRQLTAEGREWVDRRRRADSGTPRP